MKKNDNALLLYRIANYYYNENLSQNEIAQIEKVSRSQISRLLIMAREKGLVEINIKLPFMTSTQSIEQQLQELLGIERAIVVETSANENSIETEMEMIADVSTCASALLPSLLADSRIVGLGWGRTMYDVSMQLPISTNNTKKVFIPLVGNSGVHNNYLQTSSIVNRFSERFFASAFYLNSSCIQFLNATNEYTETCIQQLYSYWDNLDAAVLSLGKIPTPGTLYISELSPDLINTTSLHDACGEMLGQPFTSKGEVDWIKMDPNQYTFVGIPLSKLKNIENVICIACGFQKVIPIIQASKNGYFKTLIIDNLTAGMILEALAQEKDT